MKKEIRSASYDDTLQLISKALDGKTTMEMRFIQIPSGYKFLLNEVNISQIPQEGIKSFMHSLQNLTELYGLKAERIDR